MGCTGTRRPDSVAAAGTTRTAVDAQAVVVRDDDPEYLYYIYLYLYISHLYIPSVTDFVVFFLQFISFAGSADIYLLLIYCLYLYSYLIDFADVYVEYFSKFFYADHVDLFSYSSSTK